MFRFYAENRNLMFRFYAKLLTSPVYEVKAGNTASVSLNNFIRNFSPSKAYKLIANRNGLSGVKETLPHYFVMFI